MFIYFLMLNSTIIMFIIYNEVCASGTIHVKLEKDLKEENVSHTSSYKKKMKPYSEIKK